MLWFDNDYSEGAHEKVLQHLIDTNFESLAPYGADTYSESAREKIREACETPDADVFFLCGGTQTNKVLITSLLHSYEGAICAETGHINVHESGAIEAGGHKVISLPHTSGKVDAEVLERYLLTYEADPTAEHMVRPGLLYISQPTEYGTLYTAEELEDLSLVCRSHDLRLFVDGARLAYALGAEGNDVTLPLLAKFCDAFYIGGTKAGALCGEALVFPQGAPHHYLSVIKQHGALFAKGRVAGVQFDALFTDGLYEEIGRNVNQMAALLKEKLVAKGYRTFMDSKTNQQFFILENTLLSKLWSEVNF
ncbi:MAG: aminotransferase class I/II-fold pyridoxal phosphate-dependent enzyme, partial [Clostridia bacterium]|nr:aminotransferase class I/II-fold pyridoxal phosphate-dependent enzyme [Clostridia bacterium]